MLASVVNLDFSSSVKLALLISSIFLAKASSIAAFALTLSIASLPAAVASATPLLSEAFLMFSLASATAWAI